MPWVRSTVQVYVCCNGLAETQGFMAYLVEGASFYDESTGVPPTLAYKERGTT